MEGRAGDGAEGGGGGGGADGDIEVDELPVPEGGDAPDDRASNATEEEVEAPADVELLDDVLFNDEELFADIFGEGGGEDCSDGGGRRRPTGGARVGSGCFEWRCDASSAASRAETRPTSSHEGIVCPSRGWWLLEILWHEREPSRRVRIRSARQMP